MLELMEDIQILHFLIASVLAFERSVHFHDRGGNSGFWADAETAGNTQRNHIQSLF